MAKQDLKKNCMHPHVSTMNNICDPLFKNVHNSCEGLTAFLLSTCRVRRRALQSEGRSSLFKVTSWVQGIFSSLLQYDLRIWILGSSRSAILNHSTYPCFWESFHLYAYTCAYAHVVITSTWHLKLTHGLVSVSNRYSTALCFHENCLFLVISSLSGMWQVSFVFVEPLVTQHQSHWRFLALMELLRLLNIICMDMSVPSFGCTVRFNPWYKNFISGLRSCEHQPPWSWLIAKLLPHLWVKKYKWSPWKPLLWSTVVFSWAVMFYFMANPSALVILCELCSWTNILGGHKWHNILKLNYCTVYANITHTSKLK